MFKLIESNENGIKEVLSHEKIVWEVKNGNCVKKTFKSLWHNHIIVLMGLQRESFKYIKIADIIFYREEIEFDEYKGALVDHDKVPKLAKRLNLDENLFFSLDLQEVEVYLCF